MKRNILLVLSLFIAGSLLLSSCAGGSVISATSWPGVTAEGETAYLAGATRVFALNVNDGTIRWAYPDMSVSSKLQFYAAPVVHESTVIAGDFGHILYGLAKDTGLLQWQFEGAKNRWVGSPVVVGDTIVAPNSDRNIYGLSMNGTLKWTFAAKESNWSRPATDGKTAFTPSMDHHVYALDAASGNLLWSTDCGGAITSNAIFDEANNSVLVGTLASELLALNPADGSVKWRTKTDSTIWGYPLLHEDALYTGDYIGNAYKIDAASGAIEWKKELGSTITGAPVATAEGIAYNTTAGVLAMLDADGNQVWRSETGASLNSHLAYAADKLLVPITKSETLLDAFDLKGNKTWSFNLPK